MLWGHSASPEERPPRRRSEAESFKWVLSPWSLKVPRAWASGSHAASSETLSLNHPVKGWLDSWPSESMWDDKCCWAKFWRYGYAMRKDCLAPLPFLPLLAPTLGWWSRPTAHCCSTSFPCCSPEFSLESISYFEFKFSNTFFCNTKYLTNPIQCIFSFRHCSFYIILKKPLKSLYWGMISIQQAIHS